ncbi:uncharacterized protein E0L32_009099 [Thyridium curvatum]|uniref:Response regulatory domain-containing protein n=1 Tax=Thyridium curvatum TaxID=1093900 RepID=A0A507AZT6_9PEZI|nr:uncharacterized protein E0L32_009099 [Thyridium curvatum]TPX09760.1 hypothetical protein E0L32_009099 [Thyridium curvatum]
MGDLKARIKAKFTRRNSTTPSVASSTKTAGTSATLTPGDGQQRRPCSNASSLRDSKLLQQRRLSQQPSPGPSPDHADQTEKDLSSGKGKAGDNGAQREEEVEEEEDGDDMKAAGGPHSDGEQSPSPATARARERERDGDEIKDDERRQAMAKQNAHPDDEAAVATGSASAVARATGGSGDPMTGNDQRQSQSQTTPAVGAGAGAGAASTTSAESTTAASKLTSINELPSSTSIISENNPQNRDASPVIDDSTDTGAIDSTTDDDDLLLSHDLGTPTPRPAVASSSVAGSTPGAPPYGFSSPSLHHYHDTNTASSRFSTPQTPAAAAAASRHHHQQHYQHGLLPSSPVSTTTAAAGTAPVRPDAVPRRQSLIPARQTTLIRTLLSQAQADVDGSALEHSPITPGGASSVGGLGGAVYQQHLAAAMMTRKVWVRRPGASATLVTVGEDDVIDDVRDLILRKYGNSLGRQFDSPDLSLRIVPREQRAERTLGPEEPVGRTLDAYFPGGQSVDEALIIDVPLVRTRITPRASPRAGPPHAPHLGSAAAAYYVGEDLRPSEAGTDYFGPSAVAAAVSAHHLPVTVTAPSTGGSGGGSGHPHTISVLSTGQIPQIPSPGSARARTYRERPERPRLGRQHTSSPTIINVVNGPHHGVVGVVPASAAAAGGHGHQDQQSNAAPAAPPLPTPPAPEATSIQRTATPPPSQQQAAQAVNPTPSNPQRVGSPRPTPQRTKKSKKSLEAQQQSSSLGGGGGGGAGGVMTLGGSVPPINVLIVEDNIINLKLLEAFVKRLKVRWQTAMNGRDAVTKWRTGGFHLVLMDIQLPVMSGLDATREIRRLERVNGIGVFSSLPSSASSTPDGKDEHGKGKDGAAAAAGKKAGGGGGAGGDGRDDRLPNTDMFKSPVIIVALTASSLQSDRHEALAAGCNDFLTKPVNFVWLERKVMEWGCMQALIDFDGWRKWKDFQKAGDASGSAAASGTAGGGSGAGGGTSSSSSAATAAADAKAKAKAKKRQSLNAQPQQQAITAGGDA